MEFFSPSNMVCKNGGSWTRPSEDVANSLDGVRDCAAKCAGYTYFGLECPRATAVHCQCANTLSGSTSRSESECQSGITHCSGPYTHDGYNMGGSSRGSVYVVPTCADFTSSDGTAWHMSAGTQYTCAWFTEILGASSRCTQYGHLYPSSGYTANQACCVCGGGGGGGSVHLRASLVCCVLAGVQLIYHALRRGNVICTTVIVSLSRTHTHALSNPPTHYVVS